MAGMARRSGGRLRWAVAVVVAVLVFVNVIDVRVVHTSDHLSWEHAQPTAFLVLPLSSRPDCPVSSYPALFGSAQAQDWCGHARPFGG